MSDKRTKTLRKIGKETSKMFIINNLVPYVL